MTSQNHKPVSCNKDESNQYSSDWMASYRFQIPGVPDIIAIKNARYQDIYCQTGSFDSQQTAKQVNDILINLFPDTVLNAIIIAKSKSISGIASYDHIKKELYVSEELSNPVKFTEIVNEHYFPAKNLHDVMIHEIGGHKKHWDSVYTYYRLNKNRFSDIYDAKKQLESKLHKYVSEMNHINLKWIINNVSFNAYNTFVLPRNKQNNLNELIADVILLKNQNRLKDDQLWELVQEVISYDD